MSDALHTVQLDDGVTLPAIDDGNELRVLACLPPRGMLMAPRWSESPYAAKHPLRECDWREHAGAILDQDGRGACVGYSGASAFRQAWSVAGFPPMDFDPDFAYACINGGRDVGAYLEDMIASMASNGMAPAGSVERWEYRMSRISQAVRDRAKTYVAAKSYACRTFDEMCDAVNLGFAGSFGVTIGSGFTRMDAGGVAGFGVPRGGHAMHAVGLRKVKAGAYAGRWALIVKNSWREDFGDQGYCLMVADHFGRSMSGYAIQAPQLNDASLVPPAPIG